MHADEIHAWRRLIQTALDENKSTEAAHLGLELAKRLERDARADEIAREDLGISEYWQTAYAGSVLPSQHAAEGYRPVSLLGQNGQQ